MGKIHILKKYNELERNFILVKKVIDMKLNLSGRPML